MVARNKVQIPTRHADAYPQRRVFQRKGWYRRIAIIVNVVVDNGGAVLRWILLCVQRVGQDAGAVLIPLGVLYHQAATGIGSRVAQGIPFGMDIGNDSVAGEALANIKAGVRAAGGIVMIELAEGRAKGVDAVVTVVPRGQIAAAVAVNKLPEESVADVVVSRHVLDDNVIR